MLSLRRMRLRQGGAALLLLILAIVLIFTVVLLSSFDPESRRVQYEQRTQESLSRAKEALIAYAVTFHERERAGVLARLPCPDRGAANLEGRQDPNCGDNYASAIGLLPWNTLGIEVLKDGYGECLWYAVSGHYKVQAGAVAASTTMTNEDSPGQLVLYASNGNTLLTPDTPDGRPIAAVFAPGPPLPGQNRASAANTQCGGDYTAGNFLERVGLARNDVFNNVSHGLDRIARGDANSEDVINDRVITISKAELWNAIQSRNYANLNPLNPGTAPYPADIFSQFTIQLANCIAGFGLSRGGGDLRLPWAVPVNSVADPNWFYNDEANYVDQNNTFGGRFPFSIPVSWVQLGGAGSNDIFTAGNCVVPLVFNNLWDHWKDHVFYAVAEARAPNSANPSQPCGGALNRCLTVNGAGNYAAILMFARSALAGQSREAPPEPVDNKALTGNYLEGGNAAILDAEDGSGNYLNNPSPNFNDILICIDQNLNVAACPTL